MLRIGFVGTESSHVDHFVRFLNVERRHGGVVAAALSGGKSERNLRLAAAGGIGAVVERPVDLIGVVDAAVIASRDGADHLAQAAPLLQAGVPVLVDKPLTASLHDADALLAIADQNRVLVMSSSALRFAPEMAALAAGDAGDLLHLHVVGPADPDGEYSGLFFYGIHHIEAALEVLGNPAVDPRTLHTTTRRGGVVVASVSIAGTEVTLAFVPPQDGRQVPFRITAVRASTVMSHTLTLGPDYTAPVLAEFLGAVVSGRPRLAHDRLRAPVAVLDAVTAQLAADMSAATAPDRTKAVPCVKKNPSYSP